MSKKLTESEFVDLKPTIQRNLIDFRNSEMDIYKARAGCESSRRWRVIAERIPEEAIPFFIYCTEVASVALINAFFVLNRTGIQLYIGTILTLLALILPLVVLPVESWNNLSNWLKTLWNWFKSNILRWKESINRLVKRPNT